MAYDDAVAEETLTPAPESRPLRETRPTGHVCQHCGRVHPGGRFIAGCPGPRLGDASRSTLVQRGALPAQAEAAAALAERQAEIEADLGGPEALSRLQRDTIRDVLRLELVGEYLFDRLLTQGPLTGRGRTRAALSAYLLTQDRLVRLRQMVGLERRQRKVDLARVLSGLDQ